MSNQTSTSSNSNYIAQFKTKLEQAQSILLCFAAGQADLDLAAASTSFYLQLQQQFSTKNIQLLSLSEPLVEQIALVGIDQVKTSLPASGTIITLPGQQTDIDQIYCETDPQTNQIQILIKPKQANLKLEPENLSFQPLIGQYDLIVAFGEIDFAALHRLGVQNLDPAHVIHFNSPAAHSEFVPISPANGSYCEMLVSAFRHLTWNVNADVATNLLLGLDSFTHNFAQTQLSPNFFEAAAWLLRSGGQRTLPEINLRQTQYSQLVEKMHVDQPTSQASFVPAAALAETSAEKQPPSEPEQSSTEKKNSLFNFQTPLELRSSTREKPQRRNVNSRKVRNQLHDQKRPQRQEQTDHDSRN